MTKKYTDWLDDVNEGDPKKKTDAEAMKIVYDNAKNHFLEWAGDNLAAKASVNAYFDDYFNATTLKERQEIWSLIENSKYYDSLKNPQGSVNKNIKDWEAERRKSKQNKLKEDKEPAKPVFLYPNYVPEQTSATESESNAAQLNAFLAKPTKEYKKEQSENSANKKDSDSEYKGKSDDKHQEVSTSQTSQHPATESAKDLTLGNFFDYTNPYFQYYTAPTALGLGLGGLLGGWKGSLLGAAGGAGLGALAKYLVDNDKIHMA